MPYIFDENAKEPCLLCGHETAKGSPRFDGRVSETIVIGRDEADGFVCWPCAGQSALRARPIRREGERAHAPRRPR